ncbi:MAG: nicotinate-nucleotide adenylyltransferase [Clostridiales bacterium]|nr:nicotinate-nucleotide adenylyltransferase [Clostridiales bacterium]
MSGTHKKGIMGGTFDPIHNGHLALADCALRQYDLDEILFLPAGNPPHKQERPDGANSIQRLAMVHLAISDYPHFILDEEEMHRRGFTYTKDTLISLNAKEPDTDFFFIIGADSLMAFDTWYHPEIICKYCHLLVARREGADDTMIYRKMVHLQTEYHASVFFLDAPFIDVSSTVLRHLCRERHSIREFVPDKVADYIEKNGIYRKRQK